MSDSENLIKLNKKGRPTKINKYKKERDDILEKLNKILGISNTNNIFYICDLTEDKQKEICDLKDKVKKYFEVSAYKIFSKNVKREYLSLIKIIYIQNSIEFIHSKKKVERDGKKINTAFYLINE